MRMISVVGAALAIITSAGCNRAPSPANAASGTNQVETRSAVDQTIGTMLQYDTLKAGRNAQGKVERLVTEHNKRVGEALPEDM